MVLLRLTGATVVFQPRPGLGDMIWHLPLIRAIAQASSTGQVTLVAKPSSQAEALLAGDPAIRRIVWLDRNPRAGRGAHDGPLGTLRLARVLRACHAGSCVLLHHTPSLALAAAVGGIRHRHGYGLGAQRWWLTGGPTLDPAMRGAHAFDQATAFARAARLWPLPEPSVPVRAEALRAVLPRLSALPGPVAALGVGSDDAARRWDPRRFAALARALLARGCGTVLVLASAGESGLAELVAGHPAPDARVRPVAGWPLEQVAALLSRVDLFVGNDSGLLNLRAAVGRTAYGLFGTSGPLHHSRHIRPVVPPDGPRAGMERIELPLVLRVLAEDGALPGAAVLPRGPLIDRIVLSEETHVG